MQFLRGINGLPITVILLECECYPGLVVVARGSKRATISLHCHISILDLKHRVFLHIIANFVVHILRYFYKAHTRRRMFVDPGLIFMLK